MAFIPGAGLALVTLQFAQGDGEEAVNVMGVDSGLGVALSAAYLDNLATAFLDWFNTGDGSNSYKKLVQSSTELVNVNVRDLTVELSALEVFKPANVSGTDGGGKLPQGLTFTVTARTGMAGRSFQGRTYLVGLSDNFVNAGQFDVADSAHANEAVLAFNALLPAVAAVTTDSATSAVCVFSRVTSGAPRAAIVATPVTEYGYHDLFMDYQRRRAPAHNRHH